MRGPLESTFGPLLALMGKIPLRAWSPQTTPSVYRPADAPDPRTPAAPAGGKRPDPQAMMQQLAQTVFR